MSPLNRGEGPDEPSASKSEGEGKGKSIGDKQPLSPISMSKRNEITLNGSKRKRKDWRALSNENGGVSRRFLRSDAKKEAEAGSSRGAGTRFNLSELKDVDYVKCGDDLQIGNRNVGQLNGKVKKESNECDVILGNGEEVIGEIEHLGSGEHGPGERKEGDDVASGIEESDFPSGNEIKPLIAIKEKEGMRLLDVIKPERTDGGGNEEESEGKGDGGHEDVVTANAVPDRNANENIPREAGDIDASCVNSEGATETEKLKADTGPTAIGGKAAVETEEDMKAEEKRSNVVKEDKKKLSVANKKSPVHVETLKQEPISRDRTQKASSSKKGQKETLEAESEPTDLQRKATVQAEDMKTGDKQLHVVKKDKRKLFAGNKRTSVQVECVIVEKRVTRSSAAKQKVNDENVPEANGTTIVEGQMDEGSSGLDQADADDNELLEKIRLKKNNKKRSDSRKSSDHTDYDEDFSSMKKRVRKKQANAELDKDGSVSSGTKRELPFKREKLKMDKHNSEEKFKAARRSTRLKKPEVESEESDSSGHRMKRLRKKKEAEMEREDSVSDPNFLSSDEGATSLKKRQGQPPGSKDKAEKAKFSKFGSKSKEKIIKVQSLSELDDKPPKEAKAIVSNMIKDLLKEHGWTIQMRPRNGRDYNDQVHVSPDGTTRWSITKAYYAFLQGEHATDFTPIPEELLGLLKRTVSKERCDKSANNKNKPRGKKRENGKRLGVKSKKIKKKGKLKKKIKNAGELSESSDIYGMDAGRGRKKKGRLTLLARGTHKEGVESGENDYVPYEWKRTVLSWMIDLDVVSENVKVKYIDPNKPDPLAEGKIKRDGIECNCCGKSFAVSDFAVHAGAENGSSCLSYLFVEEAELHFLQCLVRAWEKQRGISEPKGFFLSAEGDGVDQNDDTCGVCGDGGDLVCCDKCPSTFHLGCLGMEMLPSGDWHCPYCSCVFCMKLSSCPLFCCNQCNDKFHSSCVSEKDRAFVDQDDGISFCGESCKKLFEGLEALLGVNHKMEGGFSWRLVRHITEDDSSLDPVPKLEVRAECNAKVAVAMTVMDECFLPIDDKRSGIDLLQNVVYSCKSNFVRLNFRGFYTSLLERDDEIICVASVRIHGVKLAEMPFIGTRYMYRRQGMCKRLLDGIESALSSLKVQKLIIPAITELVDTWTNVFGFSPLEGPERQELRSKSIVVFPGTGLLQKPMLVTSSKEDCDTSPTEGNEKSLESSKQQQRPNGDMSPDVADTSCADMKPDNSGEGDFAGISKPDVDIAQSVKCCGGSAEPDGSTIKYGDKLCGGLAEYESAPVPVVKSQEGFAEPELGSVLVMESPEKAKVLNGADETGPFGYEENGKLQGCAKNGVRHLTGPQLASTDAIMAGAGMHP